jgi:hypothetical protein
MDLSKLTNEELLALKAGDLSKISSGSLRVLKGEAPKGMYEKMGLPSFLDTFHDATTHAANMFTGGLSDEVNAAGDAALTSKTWDQARTEQQGILDDASKRSPVSSTVGQVVGAVANAPKAVGGVVKGTYPAMIGRGVVGGGLTGAGYGFTTGSGSTESRLENAAVGGGIGALTGGVVGGIGARQATKASRRANPTADDMFGLSDDAYDVLDKLGPVDNADDLIAKLRTAAETGRVSKTRNKVVWDTIDDMEQEFAAQGARPRDLEDWRKLINEDIISDKAQRRAGYKIRSVLEDFMQDGAGGASAKEARKHFRKAIQLRKLEDAVADAENTAGRGSRNVELHIKNRINTLLKADKRALLKRKPAQFDPEHHKQMEKMLKTGNTEAFMQWLGKLSPDSGLGALTHAALGLGSAGSSLLYQVPLGAAAFAAKKGVEGMTRKNIDALVKIVSGQTPATPQITAKAKAMLEAMTRGTVAATQ